jgi:hypothetical protein
MRPPRIDWFSFFFGVYLAIPAVGIGTVLFEWSIVGSCVIGAGIVVLIAVSVSVYAPSLPRSLARSWMHSVVVVVPTGAVFAFILLVSGGIGPISPPNILTSLLVLAGFGLAGLGMYVSADNRLVSRVQSCESVLIEWTATFSDSYVRQLRIFYITIGGVLLVGGFASMVINQVYEAGSLLPTLGGAIMAQTFVLGRSIDATAFESGLAVNQTGTIHTAFIPWNRFTGYERTDEELIIHRRLPLTSIHWDLTDIEEPDAVEEMLRDMIETTM